MPATRTKASTSTSSKSSSDGATCNQCGKVLSRGEDLKRHLKNHLEGEERAAVVHACPWPGCHYSDPQMSNLRTHLNRHERNCAHKCPDNWANGEKCDYATPDPSCLTRHRQTKHGYKARSPKGIILTAGIKQELRRRTPYAGYRPKGALSKARLASAAATTPNVSRSPSPLTSIASSSTAPSPVATPHAYDSSYAVPNAYVVDPTVHFSLCPVDSAYGISSCPQDSQQAMDNAFWTIERIARSSPFSESDSVIFDIPSEMLINADIHGPLPRTPSPIDASAASALVPFNVPTHAPLSPIDQFPLVGLPQVIDESSVSWTYEGYTSNDVQPLIGDELQQAFFAASYVPSELSSAACDLDFTVALNANVNGFIEAACNAPPFLSERLSEIAEY